MSLDYGSCCALGTSATWGLPRREVVMIKDSIAAFFCGIQTIRSMVLGQDCQDQACKN